jgi:hypothetical protein
VSITLAVSNANPLVDGTVTITATVTDGGQPVPNGTAVEFSGPEGVVLDGDDNSIVKTTTGGVATVTVTSSTVGLARIRATVTNVSRTTDINFVARPVTPTPPNLAPTIVSVNPTTGRPTGGETIRITGTNFRGPLKVLFRLPNQTNPTEVTVVNSSETFIDVITPGVNLGVGQQLVADVIVLTQAGTATENRVERTGAFTFRSERQTPVVFSVTPNSGPVTGNTRVTLVGEGFQEPVQVLFGTAEARVLNVKYGEILVDTPAGRDTSPTGTGPVIGPVDITVRNLTSQTTATLASGFNYKNAMQITGVTITGEARMQIDGTGFVGPVIVVVRTGEGDIGLGQVQVTGSRIIATIPRIIPTNCDAVLEGPIVVTNIVNGDQATGPTYRFSIPVPSIVNVSPTVVTSGTDTSFNVTIVNPLPGTARFTVGGRTVFASAPIDNGNGTATYQVPIPTNITFPTEACGTGGLRRLPVAVDVVYDVSGTTGCADTATGALTINPPTDACVEPPPPPSATVTPAGTPGSCAAFSPDPIVAAGSAAGSANITITNSAAAGARTLTISGATVSGTNGTFGITPTGAGPLAPGSGAVFTVTVDPTAAGAITGTATFTTNDPNRPTITVCLTGNGS